MVVSVPVDLAMMTRSRCGALGGGANQSYDAVLYLTRCKNSPLLGLSGTSIRSISIVVKLYVVLFTMKLHNLIHSLVMYMEIHIWTDHCALRDVWLFTPNLPI